MARDQKPQWRRLLRRMGQNNTQVMRADTQAEPVLEATRACPHCHEKISRGATVCLHCERDVVPVMSSGDFVDFLQVRRRQAEGEDTSPEAGGDD